MYDSGKIIPGIILFVGLFTFPLWSNLGKAAPAPKPELPKTEKVCVMDAAFMKTEHMVLLNDWRDKVVREANRVWVGPDGKEYQMSLQNSCMQCHASKTKFCDQCHNYAGVKPYCWECHLEPKENM
ncbi:putative sulfite reductase-associated electron transfer protein DsrJ [Desulfacinum infernum DSM 9756]|uniref:Putative sulfite reductase-associated electron transfer protein DsrJ n=1 Tax=Desulfacinum infernum DSM 9756 TaxID=1121391 RepID=A0A1M4W838_9BACT|nr:sulfate reduction electron transfer complex DsrMKJOP subunit DsrJ [Desulfacinum infernum]SHE77142.1 putative sulfite reductase-associated electron transfer protein DsrJ [Desulfacinum infernum DSM 9756]